MFFSKSCRSKARLDGKTAVITGANAGIGKETAKDFYVRGARVILACRNLEKTKAAITNIEESVSSAASNKNEEHRFGEFVVYQLDLSSIQSVRECAKTLLEKESAIHILVNNAGIMMSPYDKTEDGNEIHLQTNYLGHFLLTLLLLPKIQSSGPGCRIVNVSSDLQVIGNIHFDDINLEKSQNWFTPLKAYAQSKLANMLFTRELARRLQESEINGINVYSLHPGIVRTELARNFSRTVFLGATFIFQYLMWPFIKSPKQGAQTTIYCSVDEKSANETGLYYANCKVSSPWRRRDNETAKKLWDHTCQLLHLEPEENLVKFWQTNSVSQNL